MGAAGPNGSSNGGLDTHEKAALFGGRGSSRPRLVVATRETRVAVLCTSEVVRQGIVGLLPEEWQDHAAIVPDARSLEQLIGGSCVGVIIDVDAVDAAEGASVMSSQGGTVVVLVGSATEALAPWVLDRADAILVRDRVDQLLLRMALVAGRVGMRLLPRACGPFPSGPDDGAGPPLDEQARRVLTLLADGQRDAEMARELSLSESAVRKLVQRTVHGIGARTRCQAVAIATRNGQLQ